jgi:hypothetical protein
MGQRGKNNHGKVDENLSNEKYPLPSTPFISFVCSCMVSNSSSLFYVNFNFNFTIEHVSFLFFWKVIKNHFLKSLHI